MNDYATTNPVEEAPIVIPRTYRVTWSIDVEADSPREAAEEAQRIQRRYNSDAAVFHVLRHDQDDSQEKTVDLSIGAYQAARGILIAVCVGDMLNTLRNDRGARERIVREGFKGFMDMLDTDLAKNARDAGLADQDEDVAWALKTLGY